MSHSAQARTVIIGGGIMGCSLAYHLCKEGDTEVLLLEKGELTSGSTWHAAGQITHSVSHYGLAKMASYGTELYPRLENETGQSCSWHDCGSLRIAYEDAEVDWLKYTCSIGCGLGHDMEIIGPGRIRELHPFYNLEGVKAALHTPHDGHVDPAGVTLAMAKGTRLMGGQIVRKNRATGITRNTDGTFTVHTDQGDIAAERVVNAGGTYARQVGEWLGLDLPIANLLHHYIITDSVPEFQDLKHELPVVRDDRKVSGYIRMEQKSGLIGIYEKANEKTVWDDGTPWDAENTLFEPELERIMPWLENAMNRMPVFSSLGIRRIVHGAITHPPDGNMLLGPSGIHNFWLCCGSQVGIAWGPGAGRYLAQWMTHGAADISMGSFDPRRFGARLDRNYRIAKAREDYLLRHEIPYPAKDRPVCRPSHSKCSALYEILKAEGAVYQDTYGWERPFWYATGKTPQAHVESFVRSPLHETVGAEVAGLRNHVGIADLSAFSKLEITGKDADQFLERVSSNRLPRKSGGISLTYLVMECGRIEGEATLARLDDGGYYMVYAAVKEASLLDWLNSQMHIHEAVTITNVSQRYGVIMLAGPASRTLLASCTDTPLDNARFRWLSARTITIGPVQNVRALRVTYTGELGWELHVPMAGMKAVYQALMSASGQAKPVHVGAAALNAMRMEKAYCSGHEITNEVTLAEAGVMRFSRSGGFQGAEIATRAATRWKLACLQLDEPAPGDPQADPIGSEAVLHQGRPVGHISSGGFGYGIGHYLAFCYLPPATAKPGTEVAVLVLGSPRRAVVLGDAVRDPANQRPRMEASQG